MFDLRWLCLAPWSRAFNFPWLRATLLIGGSQNSNGPAHMLSVASNASKLLAWKDFHETFFNRVIVDFVIRMCVHSAY